MVKCSYFILLHLAVQFSQDHLLVEDTAFSPLCILASFVIDLLTISAWTLFSVPFFYVFVFTLLVQNTILAAVALIYSLKLGPKLNLNHRYLCAIKIS